MENCIIGLPVYNAAQYISHTIKNIELLEKCFKNIKIIFVYDKSKDNTFNLLKNYVKDKENVTIYINEVERIVLQAGIATGTSGSRLRSTTVCPGNDWCKSGLVNTFGFFQIFRRHLGDNLMTS